ncbi:hypothetical protein VF12_34425, partial [Nostoc linckia z15]
RLPSIDFLHKSGKGERFGIFPLPFNPFGVRQSLMGETPKTALAHLFPLTTRVQKAIDCKRSNAQLTL